MGGVIDKGVKMASFGTVKTDFAGEGAKNAAINAQSSATGTANQALADGFKDQMGNLSPYATQGLGALSRMASGNLVDSASLVNDPGYKFRLEQGNNAIEAAMAARGLGNSGAAYKELAKYGQNLASEEYDKAFNRNFQTTSTVLGLGNNAATNIANFRGNLATGMSNNVMGLGNATAAANINQANQNNALLGQGMGLAALAMSDVRLKKNIEPIDKEELKEFLKFIEPIYFEYIDSKHGDGVWAGVRAQDLEKSKLGRTIVVTNEKGEKAIDMTKATSLILAALSTLKAE